MAMSTESTQAAQQEEMLRNAGFNVTNRAAGAGGTVYELRTAECPGMRVALFQTLERGLSLGVRFELGRGAELAGSPLQSEKALVLLGALTAGLQPQNLEAHLLGGEQGLEGVMVSSRFAQENVDVATLRSTLTRLHQVAETLSSALEQRGPALLEAVHSAVRNQYSAAVDVQYVNAAVAPTFDLAERERMMQRAGQKVSE